MKAQELLMKYKLSMKDIENFEIENVTVEEKLTDFTFTGATWKGMLAKVIADNLCCHCYTRTSRTHRIAFLGREEDVVIAEITLKYAIDFIEKESKKISRQRYKQNLSAIGVQSDYALGFIGGLKERYTSQVEQHQEWGLVLSKPKKVEEAYSKLTFKKKPISPTKYKGNSNAFEKGKHDGKNFNISDKVASEDYTENLKLI